MAQPAHAPLAPGEPWILKTRARKVFDVRLLADARRTAPADALGRQFSDSDFGCLRVRHAQANPNGGAHPMVKLSLREVTALALQLREARGALPAPGVLAPPAGRAVLHSRAMKEFGVLKGHKKEVCCKSAHPPLYLPRNAND